MALPAGVTTCTVTFGKALGGALGTQGIISGTVTTDRDLIWAATGDTLYATDEDAGEQSVGGWLTFAVPHVDQGGFLDRSGNAITGFAFVFRGEVKFPGKTAKSIVKPFQVTVGQTAIDLDLLPDGTITAPVTAPSATVTSVAGLTGVVTQEQLEALGLGGGGGNRVPLFVFIGESNSGGLAVNTELTAPQLAPRPSVLIWDNDANDGFDVLDIGTNNLRGHAQITGVIDPSGSGQTYDHTRHGWENGLADSAEAEQWNEQVYLLKAGQGGSKFSEWGSGGTYWTTFVPRLAAAVAYLRAQGLEPDVYVFATIGINDYGAGTSPASFKTLLVDWLTRIRAAVTAQTGSPGVPVAFTTLPGTYASYNVKLAEVATVDPLLFVIDTAEAGLASDGAHWTSSGMHLISSAMIQVMRTRVGQGAQYTAAMASPDSGSLALNARIDAIQAQLDALVELTPPTLSDVVWDVRSTHVTDSGTGVLTSDGVTPSGGAGAVSSTPLNADNFEVRATITDQATSTSVLIAVDSSVDTNYDFLDAGNAYTAALCQYTNKVVWASSLADFTTTTTPVTYPAVLRLRNSGNDVIGEISTDGGATWLLVHTFTGVLAGLASVYPKVMFASPASGQTIRVQAG